MITGKDNLQLINQHIHQAQSELEAAGLRLEELHRQLNALHTETGERYRQLARVRLDNIQAGQLVSRLDESDQAISNLLEKLKQTRHDLQERIKAGTSRQEELEEQRKELERRRDEAGEGMRRQLEEIRKRITGTDAYRQQQERAQEAAAVAKHADEKASRTEQDQLEKGKPYEADSLFMYLWKRRYLTPDYQAGWLSRQLDGWVANLIDFRRNRVNYHMLQELPRQLREHATKAQQTAQLEAEALQTMERQAAEADGILALQSGVQDVEKQLKQHDAEMEAEVTRNRQLFQDLAALNTATDPSSKQVIELQVAALQRKELTELLREARTTPRPEDDVIVAQLQQIQQQQDQIDAEIKSLNAFLQQQQRNMTDLEELRRRYRENSYDAYNSSFPGTFSLGALLGQMLGGLMNSDMVWRELGRHHHGGPHGGDWGGFGGGPEGPGDETGGFGGGEFRTGGGF
jgi:chromosome segregation ATPase